MISKNSYQEGEYGLIILFVSLRFKIMDPNLMKRNR